MMRYNNLIFVLLICGGVCVICTSAQNLANYSKEYDFIIVGAGSGGAVVASRLSENPKWKVLLVEAGEEENFFTDIPLMAAFQTITRYNWGYHSEKIKTACLGVKYQKCNMPRGKGVGGTSIINFLLYTRGNKKDYDEWEQLGNDGWNYSSVLPYFIKSEKCSLRIDADFKKYRGLNGYLDVQYAPYETPLVKNFLRTGQEMEYKITDPNGQYHLGFSKVQATMRDGRRCSVAKAYLNNSVNKRPNLTILSKSRVRRLIVKSKDMTVKGVELFTNGNLQNILAKKEVILSAGAINSPQLLMVSGIGPEEHLKQAKVSVIRDLKVGYNLQDHIYFGGLVFLLNTSVSVSDQNVQNPADIINYVLNGKGPFTIPGGAEALAFVKTKYSANKSDDYPDIELVMGAGGLNGDVYGSLRNLLGITNEVYDNMYRPFMNTPGFGIGPILLKPLSKGRVFLNEANPYGRPIIQPNYLSEKFDLQVMVEGVKMAIRVGESKYFKKFNSTLLPIPFPWCRHLLHHSDVYWECAVRHLSTTLGHQVGTCKMGPASDPESVVDSRLRVHGIKSLRVVDGSVMPNIIAGHTNAVIIMIAEKAADMIKNDWKNL